jgi:homoserine dehydrogenase
LTRGRELRIAMVGFGNVGRRFAELLPGPFARPLKAAGARPIVTGIATARHGRAIDPHGLDLRHCLRLVRAGRRLDAVHEWPDTPSTIDFVQTVPADVLVEVSPLDPIAGEPATRHVRIALRRRLHVVTANKGPVAFALGRLRGLARRQGRLFLHEGAVMDGTPVFNLVERCLPGVRVRGFRGALNSTTSHILSRMEQGVPAAQALREAQALGIAEADPAHDLEGRDAAVKGCALANALMGASVRPPSVRRRGITRITAQEVQAAARAGRRLRLIVRARRDGGAVRLRVAPEKVPLGDPLAVSGADAVLVLETDLMGEIGVIEGGGNVDQTAYALLADLVAVAGAWSREGGRTRLCG